jgi:hypothetical protein
MTRTMLILAAALAFSASAGAQAPRVIRSLEKSYELYFRDVVFPTTAVGSVNIEPCDNCPRVVHSVTPTTVYLHNEMQLSFDQFQELLDARRATSRPTYVGVYYSVDTNLVTRIRVQTE